MKTLTSSFFIMSFFYFFVLIPIQAQDYLIDFSINDLDSKPDSVEVKNIEQNSVIVLTGTDFLHLTNEITGINDINKQEKKIFIYPNPMSTFINVEFHSDYKEIVHISVINLEGKSILKDIQYLNEGVNSFTLSGLREGFYILNIYSKHFNFSTNFISINRNSTDIQFKEDNGEISTEIEYSNFKSSQTTNATVDMLYTTGENLKFTGYYNSLNSSIELIPTESQTIYFNFLPEPDFSTSETIISVNTDMFFTDLSTNNPNTWLWNFGDGNTSTQQNPVYSYSTTGSFTVTLTVSNQAGENSITKTDLITVGNKPFTDFEANNTNVTTDTEVLFTDLTTNSPTSWYWNFGDGNTSALKNPTHSYAEEGTYSVSLTATNEFGDSIETKANYISVHNSPIADFSVSDSSVAVNTTLSFNDMSTNNPTSWLWNFGDGNTSTLQNPVHSYNSTGTYTITLTVSNQSGENSISKIDFITIGNIPFTSFNANKTSVSIDSIIMFSDLSINSPTSWYWDFGDGNTSILQNPSHAYTSPGVYSVSLITSNSFGDSLLLKTRYITVFGSISDIDGNVYNTLKIGNQEWMMENLKVTKYSDGTPLTKITENSDWVNLSSNNINNAYCWYNNDSILNKIRYGALYTWKTIMNGSLSSDLNPSGVQGVCPSGWHVPSDSEWSELENFLINNGYGYKSDSNKIAKALADSLYWNSASDSSDIGFDKELNNMSSFSARPGGNRHYQFGDSFNMGVWGFWFTSTEVSGSYAWVRGLLNSEGTVRRADGNKWMGFSVRCVKD